MTPTAKPARSPCCCRPRAPQLASLVLASRGLRKQQIARILLRGETTERVAGSLLISRHTIRDHVKTAYAKLGVTSRPELTALLLHDGAIPHLRDTAGLRPVSR